MVVSLLYLVMDRLYEKSAIGHKRTLTLRLIQPTHEVSAVAALLCSASILRLVCNLERTLLEGLIHRVSGPRMLVDGIETAVPLTSIKSSTVFSSSNRSSMRSPKP